MRDGREDVRVTGELGEKSKRRATTEDTERENNRIIK